MPREDIHPEVMAVLKRIADHLAKQRGQSRGESHFQCLYRGPNGMKCAVGCLIPDDAYDEKIEALPVAALLRTTFREDGLAGSLDLGHACRKVGMALRGLMPSASYEQINLALVVAQRFHDGDDYYEMALLDVDEETLSAKILGHMLERATNEC